MTFFFKTILRQKKQYLKKKKKSYQNYILYKKWKLLYTQNKNYLHYFYLYRKQNIKLIHLYFFYSLKKKQQIQLKVLKKHINQSPQLIKKLLSIHKKSKKKRTFSVILFTGNKY